MNYPFNRIFISDLQSFSCFNVDKPLVNFESRTTCMVIMQQVQLIFLRSKLHLFLAYITAQPIPRCAQTIIDLYPILKLAMGENRH